MKKFSKIKLLGMGIAVVLLSACADSKEYVIDHTVYVNYNSLNLFPGDQVQLQASPADVTFEWASEDAAVAKVNAAGLVEAAGAGTTNIIATGGSKQEKVAVTVAIPTADKVTARAGRNRVQLELDIRSERIKTVKVVRADNNQAMTIDINHQAGLFNAYYADLPEGRHAFSVFCYDKFGNESPPIELTATAYGETYQAQLKSRTIKAATLFGNGLCISWVDDDSYRCDVSYTDVNGLKRTLHVARSDKGSNLIGYASGLTCTTIFLPEAQAIDTFYLEPTSFENITNKASIFSAANPCEIQTRDFDIGGEGVGFHDSDNTNSGGNAYRENLGDMFSPGVDIEGGLNTGYNNTGEWLMYTVKVTEAGDYAADMYLSVNNGDGGRYSLEVDGVKTDVYNMVNNGSWGDWRWYHQTNPSGPQPVLKLTEGFHKIKFVFESGGYNFMALKFTRK